MGSTYSVQTCQKKAKEDFEQYCSDAEEDLTFDFANAFEECADLTDKAHIKFDLEFSRFPQIDEWRRIGNNLGSYRPHKDNLDDWCQKFGRKTIPETVFDEIGEEDFVDSPTSDRVSLEWEDWAIIGGVALAVGAISLLSGGTGAVPAATGGAVVLKAAGVGAAVGLFAYLGITSPSQEIPQS